MNSKKCKPYVVIMHKINRKQWWNGYITKKKEKNDN
jgi:hypothetical protein